MKTKSFNKYLETRLTKKEIAKIESNAIVKKNLIKKEKVRSLKKKNS